jgi:hypothetical protein
MGLSVFAIHCHKEGTRVEKPRNLAQLGCVALSVAAISHRKVSPSSEAVGEQAVKTAELAGRV